MRTPVLLGLLLIAALSLGAYLVLGGPARDSAGPDAAGASPATALPAGATAGARPSLEDPVRSPTREGALAEARTGAPAAATTAAPSDERGAVADASAVDYPPADQLALALLADPVAFSAKAADWSEAEALANHAALQGLLLALQRGDLLEGRTVSEKEIATMSEQVAALARRLGL